MKATISIKCHLLGGLTFKFSKEFLALEEFYKPRPWVWARTCPQYLATLSVPCVSSPFCFFYPSYLPCSCCLPPNPHVICVCSTPIPCFLFYQLLPTQHLGTAVALTPFPLFEILASSLSRVFSCRCASFYKLLYPNLVCNQKLQMPFEGAQIGSTKHKESDKYDEPDNTSCCNVNFPRSENNCQRKSA